MLIGLPGVGPGLTVGLGVVGAGVYAGAGATIEGALPLEPAIFTNRQIAVIMRSKIPSYGKYPLRTPSPPYPQGR